MCMPSSSSTKLPTAPPAPPPPEETAELFKTAKEDENKQQIARKKRGTSALKIQDKSPLAIPSSSGVASSLFIP